MNTKKAYVLIIFALLFNASILYASTLEEQDTDAQSALVAVGSFLKDAGLTQKESGYDKVTVDCIASKSLGYGVYRYVYKFIIYDGEKHFLVIAVVNPANLSGERSGVDIYLVSDSRIAP